VKAGVAVTDAQFGAFFYDGVDETGERYTLYTLSGAPAGGVLQVPHAAQHSGVRLDLRGARDRPLRQHP